MDAARWSGRLRPAVRQSRRSAQDRERSVVAWEDEVPQHVDEVESPVETPRARRALVGLRGGQQRTAARRDPKQRGQQCGAHTKTLRRRTYVQLDDLEAVG